MAEIVDHESTPERKLWLHALLRAYLDYYQYKTDLIRLNQTRTICKKTKKEYIYSKYNAKRHLAALDRWFNSDKLSVGSFMWCCQAVSPETDGKGLSRLLREAIKKPLKKIDSLHRFQNRDNYEK
jgi:hypothetical protein